MSLDNKKFKNNKTGDVVKVISAFENIAILENKQKLRVSDLLNPSLYTEEIDPASFFSNQNAYNMLAEKIKTIPTDMIRDDDKPEVNVNPLYNNEFQPNMSESAVVMTTEEDERAELIRKYGALSEPIDSIQKQNEAFAKILNEESDELLQTPVRNTIDSQVQRVEVKREYNESPVIQQQIEDPIITMFKKTKRNVDFKISLEVSDKIPRLDFIEMMEDSYEISMIDFLADEFTNKILQDPSQIRESIKHKIKQLVYGSPSTLSSNNNTLDKEEKGTEKDSKNVQAVNDQITDAVTQKHEPLSIEKEPVLSKDLPKKTTARKPREKKETTEK